MSNHMKERIRNCQDNVIPEGQDNESEQDGISASDDLQYSSGPESPMVILKEHIHEQFKEAGRIRREKQQLKDNGIDVPEDDFWGVTPEDTEMTVYSPRYANSHTFHSKAECLEYLNRSTEAMKDPSKMDAFLKWESALFKAD